MPIYILKNESKQFLSFKEQPSILSILFYLLSIILCTFIFLKDCADISIWFSLCKGSL